MTVNSSDIHDISRVLKISTYKVMSTLKKTKKTINNINTHYIKQKERACEIEVEIISYTQVDCVELDEMWSFVNCKSNQRWLWLAVDHNTRTIVVYRFGKCKNAVFAEIRKILDPFGIMKFYSDNLKKLFKVFESRSSSSGKEKHTDY